MTIHRDARMTRTGARRFRISAMALRSSIVGRRPSAIMLSFAPCAIPTRTLGATSSARASLKSAISGRRTRIARLFGSTTKARGRSALRHRGGSMISTRRRSVSPRFTWISTRRLFSRRPLSMRRRTAQVGSIAALRNMGAAVVRSLERTRGFGATTRRFVSTRIIVSARRSERRAMSFPSCRASVIAGPTGRKVARATIRGKARRRARTRCTARFSRAASHLPRAARAGWATRSRTRLSRISTCSFRRSATRGMTETTARTSLIASMPLSRGRISSRGARATCRIRTTV